MTEAKKETTAKTTAKKVSAKDATAKKTVVKKADGKTITVRQIGSPIGRPAIQRQILIGLGLNKMHRTRTLEDTPAIRGMVRKIPHLAEIIEA